jgi:hypothetical protein
MNYLFIHQNFPGQYRHVVRHWRASRETRSISSRSRMTIPCRGCTRSPIPRISADPYQLSCLRSGTRPRHLYRRDGGGYLPQAARPGVSAGSDRRPQRLGRDAIRQGCVSRRAAARQFRVLLSRPRRGRGLRSGVRLHLQRPSRLRARNGINLLAFESADWGHSATQWQRSLYPAECRRGSASCTRASIQILSGRTRTPASLCRDQGARSRVAMRSSPMWRAISSPIAAFISSCGRCRSCCAGASARMS